MNNNFLEKDLNRGGIFSTMVKKIGIIEEWIRKHSSFQHLSVSYTNTLYSLLTHRHSSEILVANKYHLGSSVYNFRGFNISGVVNGGTVNSDVTYPSGIAIVIIPTLTHRVGLFSCAVLGGTTIVSDPGGVFANSDTAGKYCLYYDLGWSYLIFKNNSGTTTPADSYFNFIGR